MLHNHNIVHQAPKEFMTNAKSVYLFVADIFECIGDDGDAHVHQIGRCDFEHLFAELLAILVNLLDGHGAHDGTLMPLQSDQCDVLNFAFIFTQKLFACGQQHVFILTLDLHLGNAGHRNWYTLAGVHAWTLHCKGHRIQGNSLEMN